jgi:hypothetical protein
MRVQTKDEKYQSIESTLPEVSSLGRHTVMLVPNAFTISLALTRYHSDYRSCFHIHNNITHASTFTINTQCLHIHNKNITHSEYRSCPHECSVSVSMLVHRNATLRS